MTNIPVTLHLPIKFNGVEVEDLYKQANWPVVPPIGAKVWLKNAEIEIFREGHEIVAFDIEECGDVLVSLAALEIETDPEEYEHNLDGLRQLGWLSWQEYNALLAQSRN